MNSLEFLGTVSKFRKQRENHHPVFMSINRELLGIFTSAVTTKKCTKSVMQEHIDFWTFSLPRHRRACSCERSLLGTGQAIRDSDPLINVSNYVLDTL